jgi:hypothetical protein
MRKAKRGFGSDRIAWIALLGLMNAALSGCGDGGSSSSGVTPTADSSQGAASGTGSPATAGGTSTPQPAPVPAPAPAPAPGATTSTNATLAWEPPTQNSDGSALTDLVGYKIHYGTASQNYTGTVAVDNPGLTRYVVDNLPAGKYYFAVAAYNSKGVESTLSNEVTASLN